MNRDTDFCGLREIKIKTADILHWEHSETIFYHALEELRGTVLHNKRALEIGCGKGILSIVMAMVFPSCQITALDKYPPGDSSSESIFSQCIKKLGLLNIALVKTDFMKNEFPDAYFDIVIINHTLHHIVCTEKRIFSDPATQADWIRVMVQIKRILKPGGVCIIKESTRNNLWRFLPLRLRYIKWAFHPTKKELCFLIRKSFGSEAQTENVVNFKLKFLPRFIAQNILFTFFVNPEFYLRISKQDQANI